MFYSIRNLIVRNHTPLHHPKIPAVGKAMQTILSLMASDVPKERCYLSVLDGCKVLPNDFRYVGSGTLTVVHDDVIKCKLFFNVTGHLCGEFIGPRWIPSQRPVTRRFHVFIYLRLNNPLSKQSWGWWFETLSRSVWRQRNAKYCFLRLLSG